MPLRFDIEKYLGTNSDGSRSDEYCYYCLKDGKYINPEKPDVPLNKNDAFQKVQKRRVQEKR